MNNSSRRAEFMKKAAIWAFIILEMIFFSAVGSFTSISDSAFLDLDNMLLLIKQSAPIGIIAMGMTIIMINGNIDLSVGAIYALVAVIFLDSMGWEIFASIGDWVIPISILIGLGVGILLGALNGLIVWKTGVDAFIVTLGSMLGYRGLVFMYNGEQPTSHLNWTLVDIAEKQFLGLHTASWAFLLVTLAMWYLLNMTVHGRNAYAIGDNREAAVNAGIRVGRHMMINFMIIGFLAALSSIIFYSESGSVNPNDGNLYELWAITAVVLGGTKLAGGAGSIVGTLGGVLAIQLLRKGLGYIGANTETVNLVIGIILIAVLYLDHRLNRQGKEELKT